MKKYIVLPLLAVGLLSCESHTYEDIEDTTVITDTITYTANVKSIIDANCVSCHANGRSASFRPLTTYAEVKDAVQSAGVLDRIQRQNGEDGIMPQTGRMPQSDINVILQWSADGLREN